MQPTIVAVTKTSRHCTAFCYLLQFKTNSEARPRGICYSYRERICGCLQDDTFESLQCMLCILPQGCDVNVQHCYTMHQWGAVHTVSRETDRPGLSLPANKVSSLPTNRLPTSCGGALLRPPGLHAPQKRIQAPVCHHWGIQTPPLVCNACCIL